MSRTAVAVLLAFATPAFAADNPTTAEQALDNHRAALEAADPYRCERGTDPDEIVVCAQRQDMRLPLPVPPEPGGRTRGDPPSGTAAMNGHGCIRLCHQPVMVPLVDTNGGGMVGQVTEAVERLLEGD